MADDETLAARIRDALARKRNDQLSAWIQRADPLLRGHAWTTSFRGWTFISTTTPTTWLNDHAAGAIDQLDDSTRPWHQRIPAFEEALEVGQYRRPAPADTRVELDIFLV